MGGETLGPAKVGPSHPPSVGECQGRGEGGVGGWGRGNTLIGEGRRACASC